MIRTTLAIGLLAGLAAVQPVFAQEAPTHVGNYSPRVVSQLRGANSIVIPSTEDKESWDLDSLVGR